MRSLMGWGAVAAVVITTTSGSPSTTKGPPAHVPFASPTAYGSGGLPAHKARLLGLERRGGVAAAVLLRSHGATLVSRRLQIWRVPAAVAPELINTLRRTGLLRYIEPDRRVVLARQGGTAADPLAPGQWWRAAVGADEVSPPRPGVPVTVLDTGLDSTHPEFAQRTGTVLLNAQDVVPGEGEEHGTTVSSVLAAPENGLGVVGIYPRALLREFDVGGLTISSVIAGLEAAIDAGPGVISMSFVFFARSRMLEDEINVAFGTGSVLVAAAGNEFKEGNPLTYPASLNHVLTVAATNEVDDSSYFSNRSQAVDLAAPGERIPVAVPIWFDPSGFSTMYGTSFAAPLVAGATAWVWTRRRRLDQTQVFDLMRYSARDIWTKGYDEDTGFGLLDVPQALLQRAPVPDPQEPNEDIYQVKANGLFRDASPALPRPGRSRASLTARLDVTEDPKDVYRVFVPARRDVRIRVIPGADVDVEIWDDTTSTVFLRGAARRRHLIDASYESGKRTEEIVLTNTAARGAVVYLDVFLPKGGPPDAEYDVKIATLR